MIIVVCRCSTLVCLHNSFPIILMFIKCFVQLCSEGALHPHHHFQYRNTEMAAPFTLRLSFVISFHKNWVSFLICCLSCTLQTHSGTVCSMKQTRKMTSDMQIIEKLTIIWPRPLSKKIWSAHWDVKTRLARAWRSAKLPAQGPWPGPGHCSLGRGHVVADTNLSLSLSLSLSVT